MYRPLQCTRTKSLGKAEVNLEKTLPWELNATVSPIWSQCLPLDPLARQRKVKRWFSRRESTRFDGCFDRDLIGHKIHRCKCKGLPLAAGDMISQFEACALREVRCAVERTVLVFANRRSLSHAGFTIRRDQAYSDGHMEGQPLI